MNQYNQNQQTGFKQNSPNCLRCNVAMHSIMQMPVRTGGISGFFAGLGEITEKVLVLDTYRCTNCRKLEFFELDQRLPNK